MDGYRQIIETYFRQGHERSYTHDEVVIQADAAPDTMYYILEGFVRVYSLNGRGEKYTHIMYGPGDIFPLAWLVHASRRNVYFQALAGATCLTLPASRINTEVLNNLGLCSAFLAQSVQQFKAYSDRVDILVFKYARERLAYQLLFFAGRFGEHRDGGYLLPRQINQQIIGSSINLSRESVSRELDRLEEKGIVAYDGKCLGVLQPAALAQEIHEVASADWWGLKL